MRGRVIAVPVVFVVAVLLAWVATAVRAQSPNAPVSASRTSSLPRTLDGKPDLQGYWSNETYTPLERPAELAGKEFFTPEEAAAFAKRRLDALRDQGFDTHYEDAIWQTERRERGMTSLRTSIIVSPANGRIPPTNAEGQRRAAERAAARKQIDPFTSAQTRSLSERCIYWAHEGPPILPTGYNSNLQIVQSPGEVVVIPEMMPVARVVPLDGRAPAGEAFRSHRGSSRGHWDGDTLVVVTTNFDESRNWRGASEALKVTERFTLSDRDTIRYEFTVEDPKTWDVPWKGEVTVKRLAEPVFEYACHEGNYGLPNILSAARAEEAAARSGSAGR
jgi:hypothetical protein